MSRTGGLLKSLERNIRMSLAYSIERQVAISAVRRACKLSSSVFQALVKHETLAKADTSPVTVADYSAQAVVNTILGHAFPNDLIVGEEDAGELRKESGAQLTSRIVELANEALTAPQVPGEKSEWGVGPGQARTAQELLNAIDRGNHTGGPRGRMWTIDPIDGTKGFLRGDQYAVCLALIMDAQVQLGVIGCPNLPLRAHEPDGPRGCLFVGVRGQGAQQISITDADADPLPLHIPPSTPDNLNMLESVEASHMSHSFNDRVSAFLSITRLPTTMDSQAKYCALARGDGSIYLRMPPKKAFENCIWDHAAGAIIVEEAGGIVTDSFGKDLNFGLGRTLRANHGIVAAGKDVHGKVIAAIQKVKEQEEKEKAAEPQGST